MMCCFTFSVMYFEIDIFFVGLPVIEGEQKSGKSLFLAISLRKVFVVGSRWSPYIAGFC